MVRSALLRIATLAAASVLVVPPRAIVAPAMAAEPAPAGAISTVLLDAGSGRVLTLPAAAANVFVADSKVAEVRPASATTLFMFGVGAGRTTVAAMDANGGVVSQFEVTVQTSNFGAVQAQAEIARLVPHSHVSVRSLPTSLMLSGSVENPADAAQAVAVAKAFTVEKQTVENQLSVRSSVQVTLQVRIVEMSRTLSRKLGINWQALGNIGQIGALPALIANVNNAVIPLAGGALPFKSGLNLGANAILDALASEGMVRTLAEPNLTVISGQSASFLVGGQFPIPVPGGALGQITVDYKNFGVSLSFLPTVFNDGRISIHVAPEVSQLSTQNAVTVSTSGSSIVVPSLTVRRAETTVELGSGQSFAIGGLLQDSVTGNRSLLPYLGDLPILGPAFRDDQFQRGETEVVILVTPYVVRPVSDPSILRVPTAAPASSDLDRLLYMRTANGAGQRTLAPTPGIAGFIVQ
jgi:pilus assembly protein CpaC